MPVTSQFQQSSGRQLETSGDSSGVIFDLAALVRFHQSSDSLPKRRHEAYWFRQSFYLEKFVEGLLNLQLPFLVV